MTKLQDLIKEYEDHLELCEMNIKGAMSKIKELGINPIKNKDELSVHRLSMTDSQRAKILYTQFLNQLKEL